jgi:hypothetical protein
VEAKKIKKVNGWVHLSKIGKAKATNQLATQLMKIPIAIALSRAWAGKISAMMNLAYM